MPQPNYLNFASPELQAQQAALERQQALADMLRKDSMTPLESTSVSNPNGGSIAVKTSPWAGLAKLGQAYLAKTGQEDLDKKKSELSAQQMAALLRGYDAIAGDSSGGSSQPTYKMDNGQLAGDTGSSSVPIQQGQGVSNPQIDQLKKSAKMAFLMGNQELGNKLLGNVLELTTEQKNMTAKGQDPRLIGALETAEARTKGILKVGPGDTAINLADNTERTMPILDKGIVMNNGVAGQIPGFAAANAGIQGAQTQATEQAKAGNRMVTINTPAGTIMVTEQQAVQMANPQGQQTNPTDQAAIAAFNQQSPPGSNRPFNATAPAAGGPLTVQPQSGIPLQSPEAQAAATDTAKAQVKRNFDQPQEQQALTSVVGSIDDALKQVTSLKTQKGLGNITGTIMGRTPNMSQPAVDAQTNLDTLKSQIGVQVLTAMRQASKSGGAVGQVTEKEWPILQNQLGNLFQAQSTDQFKKGVADVEQSLNRIKSSSQAAYNATYPQQGQQAPQQQRMRAFNPTTGRIE